MRESVTTIVAAVALAACASSPAGPGGSSATRPAGSVDAWFVQANLAGGWADGAEDAGVDEVVVALVDRLQRLDHVPDAVFLNEACESHAAGVAAGLGAGWDWVFVPTWPGHSDCFPPPGAAEGRFGNAVVVHATHPVSVVIPSCNDDGAPVERCIPNWAPPAEQRRAVCVTGSGLWCSIHLDPPHWQWHDEQLQAIARIAADLAGEHDQVVVGGDLNTGRRRARRAFERAAARSGHHVAMTPAGLATYPTGDPRLALDHLIHVSRRGSRWVDARTLDLGRCVATWRDDGHCTDHRAVVAALIAG